MREDATQNYACKRCGEAKPATAAFFSRGSAGYLMNICKPCDKARLAEFRAAKPEYFKDYMREAYHGRTMPKSRVYVTDPNTRTPAQRAHDWYSANKDRARSTLAAYRKANPLIVREQVARRRALRVGAVGTHTVVHIAAILVLQEGRCAYCAVDMGESFTVDHVVPLARGGGNGPDNLVCACGSCNSSKGTSTGDEFRARKAQRVAA